MSITRLTQTACVLIVLTACGEDSLVSTQPSGDVVSVEVVPAAATLTALGAGVQFSATARDASGIEVTGASIAWSSDDPTIASVGGSGMANAVANGSAMVTASVGSIAGSADVTVSQAVSGVDVSPSSASLDVAESVQLTAVPEDALGNAVDGAAVSWSTSNEAVATVSANGLVTGEQAGNASITASSGTASGSASVSVGGAQPTVLFQDGFESGDFASRGWYDFGSWIQTTAEARSGSGSLEIRFQPGAQQPTGLGGRHLFDETESLYFSYWVKYSTNWIGSGEGFNPHEFQFLTNADDQYAGPAWSALTMLVEHVNQNGGNVPVIRMSDRRNIDQNRINQDLTGVSEQRGVAGCNGNTDGYASACWNAGGGTYWNEKSWVASRPYFMDAPGPGYKNDWHFVETYIRLNTIQGGIGQTDGVLQYWFDGQPVLDYQDVLLRTGANPNMRFNQLIIGLWISSGSPVAQTMWLDDLTIGTARPPTP